MPLPFARAYIACWMIILLGGAITLWKDRSACLLFGRPYWRFLLRPWKVISFVVATILLAGMAPYTGDPTWDYVDATFMAVLTFTTAPWALGVLVRYSRSEATVSQAFPAACIWLFSASWSYDLYLYFRDGNYPITWWANLFASSMLYCCGGLMWSLCWSPETGGFFAFSAPDWPNPSADMAFKRIAWVAIAFMMIVSLSLLPFIWPHVTKWIAR